MFVLYITNKRRTSAFIHRLIEWTVPLLHSVRGYGAVIIVIKILDKNTGFEYSALLWISPSRFPDLMVSLSLLSVRSGLCGATISEHRRKRP